MPSEKKRERESEVKRKKPSGTKEEESSPLNDGEERIFLLFLAMEKKSKKETGREREKMRISIFLCLTEFNESQRERGKNKLDALTA